MKNPNFSELQLIAGVGSNNCVLERKGKRYTLYSNKTHTEGEFNTLAEVTEALDNDPSFK